MTSDQQVSYIAGIIEGLAYARWLKDGKNSTGMKCILNWHYAKDSKSWTQIEAFFSRHPTRQAAPLLYILTGKECGR